MGENLVFIEILTGIGKYFFVIAPLIALVVVGVVLAVILFRKSR